MKRVYTICLAALIFGGAFRLTEANGSAAVDATPTEEIDRRLAGKTASANTVNLFSAADYELGLAFTRNPNLWCADLAVYLSCFSPWNSNEHAYQGGTLITPKHALFAEHFSGASGSNTLHAGDKLVFIGGGGILYTRTLKATPSRVESSDICVGTFVEHDLPPDVVPAQVLPKGLKDDFLDVGTPVIFCNKNKEARVAELVLLTGVVIRPAVEARRAPWTLSGPAFVGDSGSPIFAVVGGRAVLLALFHAPNAGPSISANIDGINAMLGGGYHLDVAKVEGGSGGH